MSLSINGLSKQDGSTRALDRVSFDVRDGEVLGLFGRAGSGKRALFECLAGLRRADAGVVTDGETMIPSGRRRHSLFYIPDGITPWPDQTVGFVLQLAKNLYAAPTGKRAQVIDALQLRPLIAQRLGALSTEQRKRVLLALGLITSRSLLLLEEPFGGLDSSQTRNVSAAFRAEAARGRTLFLSSQQPGDLVSVCDRLILLANGRIVGEGTFDELRALSRLTDGTLDEVYLTLAATPPR